MNWRRVRAILLHTFYHSAHSMETWVDLVWFSFIGTLLYGFMMTFFSQGDTLIAQTVLLGVYFWEVVRVGQYSVTVSIMWEIWSKSFSTLFISPLTMREMMLGQMISATIKTLFVTAMVSLMSYFFFGFSIFQIGPLVLLYFALLLLFSFAAGFFIAGLIFRFGTDIQSLAWSLIFFFQPFSAVFYPLEVLPYQVRWIAYTSPIMYVMEAARAQFFHHRIAWDMIAIGTVMTLIYFAACSWFLHLMYQRSRRTGSFARLGN